MTEEQKSRQAAVHVEIPKMDCMETSAVKPLGEILGRKLDEEMTAYGIEHGFPVIFVFYEFRSESKDGVFGNTCTTKLFTKEQMDEAANFARMHCGELGVFDPKEKYEQEFLQQLVMDGELPLFCKNHHCTERGPQCARCSYTALGPEKRME